VVIAQSSIVEGASAEESPIVGEECVITDQASVSGDDPAAAAPVSLPDLPADLIAIAGSEAPNTPDGAPTPESVSAEELPAAQTVSDETHPTIESVSAEEQPTAESPYPIERPEGGPVDVGELSAEQSAPPEEAPVVESVSAEGRPTTAV
jgi:hypothetical protein